MAEHRALAEDGPLAEDWTLTVEQLEGGGWPPAWVWPTPEGDHVYRLKDVALTPTGVPNYRFVCTLKPDDGSGT